MKKNSNIFISVAVAALYFGLAGSLQAVPPPPPIVPDGGSTGLMFGVALGGLGLIRWMLKR